MYRLFLIKILFLSLGIGAQAKPMDLQIGARPLGMGGAFVAIADDINAVYWNPAGLTQLTSAQFGEHNWVNQELSSVNPAKRLIPLFGNQLENLIRTYQLIIFYLFFVIFF